MVQKIKLQTKSFLNAKGQLATLANPVTTYLEEAVAFHKQGKIDQAESIYRQLLELDPKNSDALRLLGLIAYQTGNYQVAVDMIGMAIEINPNVASFHLNQGIVFQELKQWDAAVASYNSAIALKPDYAEAYCNRGNALKELKQLDVAVDSYDKAIALKPELMEAYYNRGISLKELNQTDAAIASYDRAIALKPDYVEAHCNRGNALKELRQFEAAVASYERAIALRPDYAEAFYNRGVSQQELKQLGNAVASYEQANRLKPDYEYLDGIRQHIKMLMCDWQDFESNVLDLTEKIRLKKRVSPCFHVLSLPINPYDLRAVAELWSEDKYPYNSSLGPISKITSKSKIRIGYYSADFRVHPVSFLTVGLFEHHDKSRFELIAFSMSAVVNDEIRERISKSFDQLIDVTSMSDKEVEVLSRKLGVDIAVDLGGHTQNCRTGIFSFRAAPIQLSYIGFLGTMGAKYYDYLIADKTIIPVKSQVYYSEKIVYLPSYQVNDSKQEIPSIALSRQALNLPSSGFVYCCFNANYKITPSTFDGWMRILNSVPESVLLLYTDINVASENLKLEAHKRGVNPERLIFGEKLMRSQYLARFRSADLFLDTLPYNAGATASDALWAGLPVLTCTGESFASRYAASMLFAIGLPELVTETSTEYEELAIELATNPVKLKGIKDKLESNRLTTPLFNTALFAEHIEIAYTKMYERYQANLPPDHIYITDVAYTDKT